MKIFAETERFILREIVLEDVDPLFEMESDPEVHRYLGNQPIKERFKIEEAIFFIRKQYADNGIGRWAVIDKKTNEFIGWSGLKLVTELTNKHINYYDLGYRLNRKHWGKGVATETAKASLDFAFTVLNAPAVYAIADADNLASNKVLKKVGLTYIETFDYDNTPHHWYKIERSGHERK